MAAGTEVSHCYICLDEMEEGGTLAERQAVLSQQHGFTCTCQRCEEEAAPASAPAAASQRGRRRAHTHRTIQSLSQ